MVFGLDIETIPNPDIADKLPAPEIKLGNIKDPEKIAAKEDEARQKQLESMALDAMTCRVLCVGFSMGEGTELAETLTALSDDEELRVLEWVFKNLAKEGTRIVSWNGKDFDLPMLYKRAAILGLQHDAPLLQHWNKRYDNSYHIDLMKEWDGFQPGKFTKLDTFAQLVLNTHKEEIDFKEFPTLVQTEQGRQKIEAYCLADARIAYQGYQTLSGHLF